VSGCAQHSWVLSTPPASYHHSDAQNFKTASRLLKKSVNPRANTMCTVVWTRRAAITRTNTLYFSPHARLSFVSSVFSEQTAAYKQGAHMSESCVTLVLWVRIPLSALITGDTHTHRDRETRAARLKKGYNKPAVFNV
jgi:hypothetical protein